MMMRTAASSFFFLLHLLLTVDLYAAECLPDLGSGNICTAKDFLLTEVLMGGPSNCIEGEIVSSTITVRVGIKPTANQRYDIGFFIGDHGESPIEGESCTFSSLTPDESSGPFDGLSGNGPYRNLDGNQCGDTQKSDGEVFRDIELNDVLCQDTDNDGKLDIAYALTWQQKSRACDDPMDPANFFPPTSSKCIAAVGNIDGIEVLPPVELPAISVTKSATPRIVESPEASITYWLTIENNGTEAVTLTALVDDKFGVVDGQGDCSLPQELEPQESYGCSFVESVAGVVGSSHVNTVTATAEDSDANPAVDSDSAAVLFVAAPEPTGSIGDLVWNDLNGDGFYTPDEPGIEGIEVFLFQDNGSGFTIEATTITGADGKYEFAGLAAGIYRVRPDRETAPLNHMVHTGGVLPHDLHLAEDEQYSVADFGFAQAEITVIKTADPSVVATSSASVDYTVTLVNSGPVAVVPTRLFDSRFGDLDQGACTLPPILASGSSFSCSFTENISGSDGDRHTNIVIALARDEEQNLIFAADSAEVLFIDAANGAIGHFIWNDLNADGVYNPGEPLFNNVTVELSGDAAGTAITRGGYYSFSNLSTGNYSVTVSDSSNVLQQYVLTTANQPYLKNLGSGEIDMQANFGYAKAEIALTKTADKTAIIAPGGDVTFTVVVTNTGSIDLAINGLVDSQFGDLTLTECSLPSTLASGESFTCVFTENISGSAGTIHNNVATVTAVDDDSNSLEASDNESIRIINGVNGGLIGNLVWYDINGDGVKDIEEPGIDGITLDLLENGSANETVTTTRGGRYYFTVANGQYEVLVTDTAEILADANLSGGANPHGDVIIGNSVYLDANFGYTLKPENPYPNVSIEKATNGEDADLPPGPAITEGRTVNWEYVVTNTGSVDLVNVTVTDDQLADPDIHCPDDGDHNNSIFILPIGASATCSAEGRAIKGQYENTGAVTGTPPVGPVVAATDRSHYFGESFPWSLFIPPVCPPVPDFCYLVADGDNFNSTNSPLFKYYFKSDRLELLGHLGVDDIETITLSLDGKVLYAADNGVFGVITTSVAGPTFSPLDPAGVGSGRGPLGRMDMNDIDGLAFDPTSGILYGSVRIGDGTPGEMDLLIQINTQNGKIIPEAFGAGSDYVLINTSMVNASDVDDLAIDSQGRLFGVVGISGGGGGDHLVLIDKTTGGVSAYGPLLQQGDPVQDMEGLTLYNARTLYGSTGIEFGAEGTANTLYWIDKATGETRRISRLDKDFNGLVPNDFEAISCFPICK